MELGQPDSGKRLHPSPGSFPSSELSSHCSYPSQIQDLSIQGSGHSHPHEDSSPAITGGKIVIMGRYSIASNAISTLHYTVDMFTLSLFICSECSLTVNVSFTFNNNSIYVSSPWSVISPVKSRNVKSLQKFEKLSESCDWSINESAYLLCRFTTRERELGNITAFCNLWLALRNINKLVCNLYVLKK